MDDCLWLPSRASACDAVAAVCLLYSPPHQSLHCLLRRHCFEGHNGSTKPATRQMQMRLQRRLTSGDHVDDDGAGGGDGDHLQCRQVLPGASAQLTFGVTSLPASEQP